ncbi:hypothetical protein FGB62_43g09 [Gracilaria domingensis]|nr:hypothetical protein FGB62_43g09 [Gracilaria domingensis]
MSLLFRNILDTCREALALHQNGKAGKSLPEKTVLKALAYVAKGSKGNPVFAQYTQNGMFPVIMNTDFTEFLVEAMDEIGKAVHSLTYVVREDLVTIIAVTLRQKIPVGLEGSDLRSRIEGGPPQPPLQRGRSAQFVRKTSLTSFGSFGDAGADYLYDYQDLEDTDMALDFFKQFPLTSELHRAEIDLELDSNASFVVIDGLFESPIGSQASSLSPDLSVQSLPRPSRKVISGREYSPCVDLGAISKYSFSNMSVSDLTAFMKEFVVGYLRSNSVKGLSPLLRLQRCWKLLCQLVYFQNGELEGW